jgi:hypothetical protein
VAAPIIAVSDSATLLWRLSIYGHDVPKAYWEESARYAEPAFPDAGFSFADVHLALNRRRARLCRLDDNNRR